MNGSSGIKRRGWSDWKFARGVGENRPFSPRYADREAAQEAIENVLHQRPDHWGLTQTRWTLSAILQACSWIRLKTLPGLHQVLQRLRISRKRGRAHLHSPDPDYTQKLRPIWLWIREVRAETEKQVLLFSDEFTFYRQPSLSSDYERKGPAQPLAELGYRSNLSWRIAAALNAWTGQVTYAAHSHFTIKLLVDFYQQIAQNYPQASIIYLVVDNWPVHFHPDVLAALRDPSVAWPLKLPHNWPMEASRQARYLDLPIRIVPLPTYAPWNNPIEKLWLLLKKQVLHLHRFEDDWDSLKARVNEELDQYLLPSVDLLRFVGLQDPLRLYHALFQKA